MNRYTGSGIVATEPKINKTKNGSEVLNFTLQIDESWQRADGKISETTHLFWVSIFLQELINDFYDLKQGERVLVDGSLRNYKFYEDGITKYGTSIDIKNFNHSIEVMK